MTYDKAEDKGYLVARRMMRNHERITERTGSILAREFADDYAYSDTPVSPSRLKEAFLRGFDKGVEDAIEGRRDPKGRRPARKSTRKPVMKKYGGRWCVHCQGAPARQTVSYYRALESARAAARSLSKKYGRASVRDEKGERKPEFFAQGSLSSYEVRGSSARKFRRLSRRDVSRADLKHLSGSALLKLLRQAVRKGDEDLAEAIGKELDRRSKY